MTSHPVSTSRPNAEVDDLLENIAAQGSAFSRNDPHARTQLIENARTLIAALETPMEALLWMTWAEPTRDTAARLAVDLGIFDTLAENGGHAKTSAQLAAKKGAALELVTRLMRHMVAMKMVKQVGTDSFIPTAFTRSLTTATARDTVTWCFDVGYTVASKMPEYFASTGYKNPTDTMNCPFQIAYGTDLQAFAWMAQRPENLRAFQSYMTGYSLARPRWTDADFYPVAARLAAGLKGLDEGGSSASSALVDVGGGSGHDLAAFRQTHPQFKGRLILQDLPEVVAQIKQIGAGIEVVPHNFFEPQPIRGARAYYLHWILHDWPDDRCREILLQLKAAMEPSYSKVLINETVVADTGAAWQHTSLDIWMMALFASGERTETRWRKMLESVGLEVAGIWTKATGVSESVIEAVLPETATLN